MKKFNLDPAHSTVQFSIKHMMIAKVHGTFDKLQAELNYNELNINESAVKAKIDVDSINTKEPQRDNHLKSADFFDIQKFPTIEFQSTNLTKESNSELKINGLLTIHGVTKEVTLISEGLSPEMKDPWGNIKLGISAKTSIKRKDFGLNWNAALEAGGVLVGDEVQIQLDLQFLKV